ncbi:MAG: hypothetical protein QOC57_233 [Ilumatobacteraceae bacterium]
MTSSPETTAGRRRLPNEYSVVVSSHGLVFLSFWVVVTIMAIVVIDRASTVFVLLGAAITVAVIAAPAVRRLSSWMPRGAAIALITVAGMVAVVAVLAVVARDVKHQERAVRTALHQAISDLPADSTAAHLAATLNVDGRIDGVLNGAANQIVIAENDPVAIGGLVGKLIVVAVLAAFMIGGGHHLISALIRLARRSSIRQQLHETLNAASARSGAFLRRTLVVSVAHGCVAALTVRALDLPAAISLGAWVAMMSTVPILGSVAAWAPIVVLGWVHHVSLGVLLAVALAIIVADRIARARWVHGALRVGPLLAILGIAGGLSMIGLSGAVLGMFVVAFGSAVAAHQGHLAAAVSDLIQDPADRALPDAVDAMPIELSAGSSPTMISVDPSAEAENVVSEVRNGDRIIRLRLSGRTAASAAAIVITGFALVSVFTSFQPFLIWFAVGGFIAAGLDRPISALHRRWKIPRVAGTSLMLGCAVGVVVAVVVIGGPSISDSTRTIATQAPETVRSMESLPLIGGVLHRNGAADKVERFINSLPDRLRTSKAVDRVAAVAGDGVLGAFWTLSILLAILWDGPRLVGAICRRVPISQRARAIRFGRAAYTAVSNVVAAAFFVAALNGTVVMMLALALGIPLAPILGLWAMSWNFIPQIGGFVGAVPLVALGLAKGPWQGVIALVVFITYQMFENHVIQPFVGSRAVHLPPLVVMIGALFGGVVGGFAGVLVAGPALGVAKIAVDEFRSDRRRIEDRVERQPVDAIGAEPRSLLP